MNGARKSCEGPSSSRCSLAYQWGPGCHCVTAVVSCLIRKEKLVEVIEREYRIQRKGND